MFGFLALVFIILVVTCAEITIVLCYLHLCAEEYRWWWRAFLTSGAVAGDVLACMCVWLYVCARVQCVCVCVFYVCVYSPTNLPTN